MNRTRPMAALGIASALLGSLLIGIVPAHAVIGPAATYFPLTPSRLLDTRNGTGAPATRLGAGANIDLTVVGAGGVPASGVAAVVLNITATLTRLVLVLPAFTLRFEASGRVLSAGKTVRKLSGPVVSVAVIFSTTAATPEAGTPPAPTTVRSILVPAPRRRSGLPPHTSRSPRVGCWTPGTAPVLRRPASAPAPGSTSRSWAPAGFPPPAWPPWC